jgi:hypothetical protein
MVIRLDPHYLSFGPASGGVTGNDAELMSPEPTQPAEDSAGDFVKSVGRAFPDPSVAGGPLQLSDDTVAAVTRGAQAIWNGFKSAVTGEPPPSAPRFGASPPAGSVSSGARPDVLAQRLNAQLDANGKLRVSAQAGGHDAITVNQNDRGDYEVTEGGQSQVFAGNKVRGITVDAAGGDNRVVVGPSTAPVSVRTSGDGNTVLNHADRATIIPGGTNDHVMNDGRNVMIGGDDKRGSVTIDNRGDGMKVAFSGQEDVKIRDVGNNDEISLGEGRNDVIVAGNNDRIHTGPSGGRVRNFGDNNTVFEDEGHPANIGGPRPVKEVVVPAGLFD